MNKAVPARLLKTFSLAAVIFLTVSGGPYGLEPLMQYAGKNGALLLLLLVPLLWDLPTILTVLELNSMMPVEGGYYKWVKRALGTRWAFFEAWWSWLYSFTDLAIYPVLFVTYISFFSHSPDDFMHVWKIPICLAVIWISAGLNILGIVSVGRVSLILSAVIIIPFVILFITAFSGHSDSFTMPVFSLRGVEYSALGMGIYVVMWNFLGWDNCTTYAGEVDKPIKSYVTSISIAFVTVIVLYLLTIYITQNSGIDFAKLSDELFPILGVKIGGQWLGALLSIGGMASALGIFSAVMLSISRVPKVLADDKLLHPVFSKQHSRFGTPYISIIIYAVVVSFMILWTFEELIVIDVILYGAGLFLEFISLVALRVKEPEAPRPFKIRLNTFWVGVLLLLPVAVYCIALTGMLSKGDGNHSMIYFALGALLTAEIAWRVAKWNLDASLKPD
jgi:amino acid transporter